MNIKILLKSVPGMFDHSDKNVRAEVSIQLLFFIIIIILI